MTLRGDADDGDGDGASGTWGASDIVAVSFRGMESGYYGWAGREVIWM
jgi:hypothetical protein